MYSIFLFFFHKLKVLKGKITKILNSEKNSKRKVPNQMAKSNDKTHQTNGQQLSYSRLRTAFSNVENGGLNLFL